MASQSADSGGSVKVFTGDDEDAKEYKRWKVWITNKLLTLDKLPAKAKGAYLYTLLGGKALEAVEHVDASLYQKEGGEDILFALLDKRFPQKEAVDELGEVLGEVFALRVKDGENMKMWCARSQEIFDKCRRKSGVDFPDQARGWLTLHRAGLSDEQKAVVIARSGGDLTREKVSSALRSCYPDLVAKRKAIAAVDEVFPVEDADDDDDGEDFKDVQDLLDDHQDDAATAEEFPETDVAEVLAATWKEKRQELGRLQKSRQFGKMKEVKRSFRVEVEELKARTSCNRCGRRGHWARECTFPPKNKGSGKGQSSTGQASGAAMVVTDAAGEMDFVASVGCVRTLVELVRDRVQSMYRASPCKRDTPNVQTHVTPEPLVQSGTADVQSDPVAPFAVCLVSSPGYGVIDSGCGRTIVGEYTLKEFERLWRQKGISVPAEIEEMHQFKFGNGEVETSNRVICMPVSIAGKMGSIRASIVKGYAPLLISRTALKKLKATLYFGKDYMEVFGTQVPLKVNEAGQYVISLLGQDRQPVSGEEFAEVMTINHESADGSRSPPFEMTNSDSESSITASSKCPSFSEPESRQDSAEPDVVPAVPDQESEDQVSAEVNETPKQASNVWIQEDVGVRSVPWLSPVGPHWNRVFRRVVRDAATRRVVDDHTFRVGTPQKQLIFPLNPSCTDVITEFHYLGKPVQVSGRVEEEVHAVDHVWHPSLKQARRLLAQAQVCREVLSVDSSNPSERLSVMEIFSPPRFTPVVEKMGLKSRAYDLKTGYDLSKASDRKRVEEDLLQHRPDLVILCPPCTHEGGWFNLNASKMERWEFLQKKAQSRSFIRWCCRIFKMQSELGGRCVFEHPTGAKTWTYPEMQSLCKKYYTTKLHMCRYEMKLPNSEQLIRKSTRLLLSHDDMKSLGLLCPGVEDPKHRQHDVIAGSAPGVPSVSAFAGAYPIKFVHAVLDSVPELRHQPVFAVGSDLVPEELWSEVCAITEVDEQTKSRLLPVIQKLHKNLGHPPTTDLVRILKHGQASDEAIAVARTLECDFCKSQSRPGVALPAQPNRVSQFNKQIGLDVKNLRGWRPNQKVKAVNIVDTASGFQRVIPFFQTETSALLRQTLADHWITWAGPPGEIVLDPAQTNLGDPMVVPCEMQGTQIRPIAAGAHWQLGKTESHGGWFAHVLDKLIEEHQPRDQNEWLECVRHAHIKNQMLQVHGFSPHQFVFGTGANIPGDLLNEPLSVVAGTASLTDDALARAQSMRVTARVALARMQDDRALRVALLARPRRNFEFKPGDLVAYWRSQKWVNGQLQQGSRWYGPAVVIGTVGRNVIVVHRRQILRCAPEQLRPSTTEERQLTTTPQAELLGIKQLVENGGLQSKNYIDLTPESYPPMDQSDSSLQELQSYEREQGSAMQEEGRNQLESQVPTEGVPNSDAVLADRSTQQEEDSEVIVMTPKGEEPTASDAPAPVNPVNRSQSSASSSGAPSDAQYGPMRTVTRRVSGKDGPLALYRPPAMREDDFVDIMKDIVPELVEQAIMSDSAQSSGLKRPASEVEPNSPSSAEPATVRARHDEVLSVQECHDLLTMCRDKPDEVFLAEYLKKKMSKELPHSKNEPDVQRMVDEGKMTEWQTLLNKPNAIKIHYGKAAEQILSTKQDRFIGSRFVLTRKAAVEGQEINPEDLSTYVVKARWCLQGHLDPDLEAKAEQGLLKSPTLSQLGRNTLMQILASKRWDLQLGDIKGAFLEAGPLDPKFTPLYARQPPGGIPGLPSSAVIEVKGNVYGQNDAPAAWFKEFCQEVISCGWQQSKLDPCLFTLRDNSDLIGVMGVHVDDTALGGVGKKFEESVAKLKSRFPYRKWRVRDGEFCGAWYKQEKDGTIHMSMESFADKMRPINVPRGNDPDTPLNDAQIRVLRAVNGGLNWLSSQSRPDLAVQTSLSQQSCPKPTISDFRKANQAVRRAKQERFMGLTFKPIPLDKLTIVCHSDAAWANVGTHTQAGYIIAFTEDDMQQGKLSTWCPVAWRSYRLSRAVSSTLAAESQALATASSTVEWLSLLVAEIIDGPLEIQKCREALCRRRPILVTDCKSLYDHLHSPSSPTSIEDRRTSIDVVIIRESCRVTQAFVRWVPTNRMLADAFTKDLGDPIDLLRACLRSNTYQISDEETILEMQAAEKQKRLERRACSTSGVEGNSVQGWHETYMSSGAGWLCVIVVCIYSAQASSPIGLRVPFVVFSPFVVVHLSLWLWPCQDLRSLCLLPWRSSFGMPRMMEPWKPFFMQPFMMMMVLSWFLEKAVVPCLTPASVVWLRLRLLRLRMSWLALMLWRKCWPIRSALDWSYRLESKIWTNGAKLWWRPASSPNLDCHTSRLPAAQSRSIRTMWRGCSLSVFVRISLLPSRISSVTSMSSPSMMLSLKIPVSKVVPFAVYSSPSREVLPSADVSFQLFSLRLRMSV